MRLLRRTTVCVVAVIAGLFGGTAVAHAQTVASTTTVSVSPDPTVALQTATLTAVVAGSGGTPTGTVQFTRNGTPIGQAVLANGTAQIAADAGSAGSSTVRAAYGGGGNFDPSSGELQWNVRRANTTTRLESSPNPVASLGMFDLIATVEIENGLIGSGTLEFTVAGIPFDDPVLLPASNWFGYTIWDIPGPVALPFSVTYSGDTNTAPSSSSLVQQIAGPPVPPPPPPPLPPTAQPATPTPTPPPPPATLTASTLKQMTAGLRGTLRRRGLAGLSGATQTLTTPVAGRLEQAVYTPSATARKRTLLATARRTFAAAGTGKLTLRLTAAGRRKLKSATTLKLAIVTRFTPTTGSRVTVVDRLTARKRSARAARALSWHVVSR